MLALDSPRWAELNHAYGSSADIPALLRRLENGAPAAVGDDPWDALWSALAHQGDVYPASFAAVPHVVAALAANPANAEWQHFAFPAWVEICRQRNGIVVPADLAAPYVAALGRLPALVGAIAARDWESDMLPAALAAVAAAKGQPTVAEAALELTPEVAAEFMKWFAAR